MSNYADYLPGGSMYQGPEQAVVEDEIEAAQYQQTERKEAPVQVNWEDRYKNLEQAFSKQGQQIGDYRKLIDDYVASTPEVTKEVVEEVRPITPDDLYENPDEAVRRAIDSHPAIRRAQELEKVLQDQQHRKVKEDFMQRHPEFDVTIASADFAEWVRQNPMRLELAQRADGYDLTAADALFTLWENSHPVAQPRSIDELQLEVGSGSENAAEERYSRSKMLEQKILAKQGNRKAEAFVRVHARRYRDALARGNVRD